MTAAMARSVHPPNELLQRGNHPRKKHEIEIVVGRNTKVVRDGLVTKKMVVARTRKTTPRTIKSTGDGTGIVIAVVAEVPVPVVIVRENLEVCGWRKSKGTTKRQ